MADDLENSRQWRDTVETRLGKLEAKVEEQAGLRAAMDEDMSSLKVEFRAQRTLLQSLHDTQQEHTALFREHTALLRDHTAQLNELREGQGEILAGVRVIRDLLERGQGSSD
jgi:chromosome segregation ATPase